MKWLAAANNAYLISHLMSAYDKLFLQGLVMGYGITEKPQLTL